MSSLILFSFVVIIIIIVIIIVVVVIVIIDILIMKYGIFVTVLNNSDWFVACCLETDQKPRQLEKR